jgi:hypothetical protein
MEPKTYEEKLEEKYAWQVEINKELEQKLAIALELIHKLRQLNKWNKGVSDMIHEALGKIEDKAKGEG